MKKYSKSKSSLFLMEFIVTLMLFAICSAVCMQMFAATNSLSQETYELNEAVAIAQSFAEVIRAGDGSMDSFEEHIQDIARANDNQAQKFYDKDFNPSSFADAAYSAQLSLSMSGSMENARIRIERIRDRKEVYSLNVSKYISGYR